MIVIAAMLVALWGAREAAAQTVASLNIISGDGQVLAQGPGSTLQLFQPMIVQALDSHGNAVAKATITWTLTRTDVSNAYLDPLTTTTDSNGMSSNVLNERETNPYGTAIRNSLASSIVASANGGSPSATFSETYALIDQTSGASEVKSDGPIMNGQGLSSATLSGNSGSTLPNIQILVESGTSNTPVQGVSIELLLAPGQTTPTISCDPNSPSPTGNPGTVLSSSTETSTNPPINATCTPRLGGSGTGQFYVMIGGVSTPSLTADGGTVNTNGTAVTWVSGTDFSSLDDNQEIRINGVEYVIATVKSQTALVLASSAGIQNGVLWLNFQPLFLERFGPYNFTSLAGLPTAIKLIQGNNQALAQNTSLGTLIAEVVDSRGNAVSGANVTWTIKPDSAKGWVVLANTTNFLTTDNNGQVSTLANFSGQAAGNINITVALVANSAINATFTETALVTIRTLQTISGDQQTAVAGTVFAKPLIVQVNGNSGPITNYPVQFSISGAPGTILSQSTAVTDSNGLAQVTVTAGNTTGTVTVSASVVGLSQAQTFTLTVRPTGPTPTGIAKVSGDLQNAVINTNFPAPLTVQVNSTSGPVGNTLVQFSATPGLNLSSNSGTTNSAGQTQVTATAGSVTGPATVTASLPGTSFFVTFNLTVNPPGPTLTAASFANGASGQASFLSPCGIATITAAGLAPNGAASLFPAPVFGPLPTSANGITVLFNNFATPIYSATMVNGQPQLMVQVPCEVTPAATVPVTVNVGAGSATVNVPVGAAAPGIFTIPYSDGVVRAVVLRADGSFVTLNPPNPARRNEIVRVYVTGLGPTTPPVGTGQVDNPGADLIGADALATGKVIVGISGSGGVTVTSARLAANMIGVFEVAFIVPNDAPQGNDIGISVGVVPAGSSSPINSLATKIPIL
jgi:uncharacterized protein (TIGR03437 family)